MKVVRTESSTSVKQLAKFANDNNIGKEDIINIVSDGNGVLASYTLFFFGEPVEEKVVGKFLGIKITS
ncbi:MAG TPA: hypothetical protein VNY73_06155 [Bacteroidia bacterium]|jgi:hypothetical protein|nr:hypothetical protein [Bacteroidia bacterium]